MLYISTSVWVLRTLNDGRNSHFQHFLCNKAFKKQEICSKILPKTRFLSLHQNAGQLFFPPKKMKKTCFYAETNDFDQRTACGAPTPWSKFHKKRYLTMAIISCYFKFARKKPVGIFFVAVFTLSGFQGPPFPPSPLHNCHTYY